MPTDTEAKKDLSEAQRFREEKRLYTEARVRKLYAQGPDMTDAEIGRQMGLNPKTVTSIRSRLKLPARPKGSGAMLNLNKASGKWPTKKRGGAR